MNRLSHYIFLRFLTSLIFVFLLVVSLPGCKKFVAIAPPSTQIVTASVFINDASAVAAMDGVYSGMIYGNGFSDGGNTSFAKFAGLSADEMLNYNVSTEQAGFYKSALSSTNSLVFNYIWKPAYKYIYYANAVLDGLDASSAISAQTKTELQGEARFVRAFCHSYLLNISGDVPLVLSTSYKDNSELARTSTAAVYGQIITDLTIAQNNLAGDFSFSKGERVRPNKWAATALLARVFLYNGNWDKAVAQSTSIISNTAIFSLVPDLNKVFLKNSTEAIWQLMPVIPGNNTNEGILYILKATPSDVSLAPGLIQAFETGDKRRKNWVDSITIGGNTYFFPVKYKIKASGQPLTEYSMVLRLAEQYLIRAEANIQLGNSGDALVDLNLLRARAGLTATSLKDKASLLLAIEQERKMEFFSEWGHRWLDLKRTNRASDVLTPLKGAGWQATDVLYPIPQLEINNNSNLRQNPGY